MIKKDCFAYNDEKNECNACKDLKCQNCAFYKEKGKTEMIKSEEVREIIQKNKKSLSNKKIFVIIFTKDEFNKLDNYIEQQEKKDELLTKIKDILALNYSYQEIGIKIERLFREELK